MSAPSLAGRSIVVVGASSGIGKGVAERGLRGGARVVAAARRAAALAELVGQVGDGHAVAADLRDADGCRRLAAEVATVASPVDLLLVSAGMAPLRRLALTTAQDWEDALFPPTSWASTALSSPCSSTWSPTAVVAVVSSEAVDSPRSHLGAYGASKAALEHMLRQWREEHPWIRFATISLGATVPTEFGQHFAPDDIVEAFSVWTSSGRNASTFMNTEDVCDVLVATFATLIDAPSVGMPRIELRSPAPAQTDNTKALADARGQSMQG